MVQCGERRTSLRSRVQIQNQVLRLGLAETLCTYMMMTCGLASVAQVVTGKGAFGQFISINLSFGLAVALGIHVGGGVSGAHMNAAVSFTFCVFGTLSWRLLPLYIGSQLIGSFLAAVTVYAVYYEAIHNYCGGNLTVYGPEATAGIFSTYPAPYLSLTGGFIDQVFGTSLLLLGLSALSDRRNTPCPPGGEPVAVGLLVLLIGMCAGSNSGYAINPSRDLGPRVFTALAGWGLEVFRAGQGWWWVPLVAPCVGGVLGTGLYKLMVQMHHPSAPSSGGTGELQEGQGHTEPLEKQSDCIV
ncbi:unnamed protein product [Knipowitschia caucasica]|uniref:Aquaporin n=1 Tax=Knipowitschia caucasica TaxID=637954 RepID=A0AAV2M5V1_KNICA